MSNKMATKMAGLNFLFASCFQSCMVLCLFNNYFFYSVSVKPRELTLSGLDGVVVEPSSIGQPVEVVTIPHRTAQAKIKCQVGPAKPAVPIKWQVPP